MKVIKPSFEFIDETNILKKIECAGRICYKSEDKITEDSYKNFITNIIARKHESVLEHGHIIIELPNWCFDRFELCDTKFFNFSKYSNIISGNVRAFREYGYKHVWFTAILSYLSKQYDIIFDDFKAHGCSDIKVEIIDPNELIDKEQLAHVAQSILITCDRGVSHEIVRHRIASYSQESTRYVNYGKADSINIINIKQHLKNPESIHLWLEALRCAEMSYMKLLELGETPQIARSVLPNSTKTEVFMTTTLQYWHHFGVLRTAPAAHPQMREVAIPIIQEFQNRYPKLFDDIEIKQ